MFLKLTENETSSDVYLNPDFIVRFVPNPAGDGTFRIVGRLDPKLHRDDGVLEIKQIWWEPGIKPTKPRLAALDEALHRYARFAGATDIKLPDSKPH